MIQLFDVFLRDLFLGHVTGIANADQVRFQPPDEEMRNFVRNTLNQPALNVFLADVRDNRKLRSNEFDRHDINGDVILGPPPDRIDCHYLITAWRPEVPGAGFDPTPSEHDLLYQALAQLLRALPLNPTRFYGEGSAKANAWPENARTLDIPAAVLTVDGFQRFAELWHGMGTNARWKPALHVVATLPVLRDQIPEGPMVVTQITEYRISGVPSSAERWVIIGGTVRHPDTNGVLQPVANAWVRLEPPAGGLQLETITDADGRFLLQWPLRRTAVPEKYTIRSSAEGLTEKTLEVYFPGDASSYDLTL